VIFVTDRRNDYITKITCGGGKKRTTQETLIKITLQVVVKATGRKESEHELFYGSGEMWPFILSGKGGSYPSNATLPPPIYKPEKCKERGGFTP
jgi:hypothetical protein